MRSWLSIAPASIRTLRALATGWTRRSGSSSPRSSSSCSAQGRTRAAASVSPPEGRLGRRSVFAAGADEEPDAGGGDRRDHEGERTGRAGGEKEDVEVRAEADRPERGDDALVDARCVEVHGAIVHGRKTRQAPLREPVQEIRRVCRGFVHNSGRLSDLSPCGLPRTASRCCFNLLPRRARRTCESTERATHIQGLRRRKARILRIFNNQHFHSTPCILWISRGWRCPPERRREPDRSPCCSPRSPT